MSKLNKILLIIAGAILLSILAVTAISLGNKNIHPGQGLRKEDPLPSSLKGDDKTVFNGIGQIRIFTKEAQDSQKGVVLLIPWFEYSGQDKAFYEELDRKHLSIKALITKYFSSHTKAQLLSKGEDSIKEEIKSQINENLVLGKIEKVYFNDYLFID